ncbi:MAG TPA: ATP-dependent RNA helicase DbpA, partial [Cellvibrionaceae bacterium]
AREIRKLARAHHNIKVLTLCGGVSIGPQLGSLEHGAHIIVGTPGRILDHLRKNSLKLDQVQQLVLDEADRMLDMGFAEAVETILGACEQRSQTLLFSATYPDEILRISARYQRQPEQISVESVHSDVDITQHFYELADSKGKTAAVEKLLAAFAPRSAILFCNTKQQCQDLAEHLQQKGIHALALNGDLEQKERDQVMVRFANKSCPLLIATDVAARGIDVKELDAVINVELSHDPEVHVHRIGRTGRAGESGLALSLVAPKELGRLNRLEDYLKSPLTLEPMPEAADHYRVEPEMVTLNIDGGKKDKLRPGDILGALTKEAGLNADEIGKIDIFTFAAYVAVKPGSAKAALLHLQNGKLKGRKFRTRRL